MRCNNFGIGLIALSITLILGITIGEFFKIKDIPSIEVIEEHNLIENTVSQKKCVPKDGNLKYQNLPFDKSEKNTFQKLPYSDGQLNIDIDRLTGLNKQLLDLQDELEKVNKSDTKKVKEIKRVTRLVEREFEREYSKMLGQTEKDGFNSQYQYLIYLEKCFDNK